MMDFDQMMDSWKAQDETPLYGVNHDLLQLVLRHEEADIRRAMRWEHWTNIVVGAAMAGLGGAVLWWFLYHRGSGLYSVAAAVGAGAFALWVGALWQSRRRQAARERGFGNSLQDEIRRNLSLVDYQLSHAGRWTTIMLWSAPIIVGASLIFWLITEINDNSDTFFDVSMIVFIVVSIAWTARETSRKTSRELLPRKQRLNELLEMLRAG